MPRTSTMIIAALLAGTLLGAPGATLASAATPTQTATWQTVVTILHA